MQYGLNLLNRDIRNLIRNFIVNNKLKLIHIYYMTILKMGILSNYTNIDWNKVKRLVFICRGNICRSPYAEYKAIQLGLSAISMGIYADGKSSAHHVAIKQSAKRNVELLPHISSILTTDNLLESDLIICMEPWQANSVKLSNADPKYQNTLLGLWCNSKAVIIPDPYGKPEIYFKKCFDQIDNALLNIATKINSE